MKVWNGTGVQGTQYNQLKDLPVTSEGRVDTWQGSAIDTFAQNVVMNEKIIWTV